MLLYMLCCLLDSDSRAIEVLILWILNMVKREACMVWSEEQYCTGGGSVNLCLERETCFLQPNAECRYSKGLFDQDWLLFCRESDSRLGHQTPTTYHLCLERTTTTQKTWSSPWINCRVGVLSSSLLGICDYFLTYIVGQFLYQLMSLLENVLSFRPPKKLVVWTFQLPKVSLTTFRWILNCLGSMT